MASDGTVLYDTRTDTQPMENHGQREEIREALADPLASVVDAIKGVLIADDDRKHFAGVRHLFWDGDSIRVEVEEDEQA